MASNSCTFIIVPDATSQCKRYNIPKVILLSLAIGSVVCLVLFAAVSYSLFGEYRKMSLKIEQLEQLEHTSLKQKNTLDRYEQDITQLSKQLAQIRQLNTRLMILTGLDPANGDQNLGGFEEVASHSDTAETKDESAE